MQLRLHLVEKANFQASPFGLLPPQVKQPQPHLQRIHHTIGQHGHLPGHRPDTLLKLGNVSGGQHVPQRHTTCQSKGKGDPEPGRKPVPVQGALQLCSQASLGAYLLHERHPCPQRGPKS